MISSTIMKKIAILIIAALLFAACNNNEKQLRNRATELCKYIPDHELLEQSKDFMTADFYAVLDTLFHQLPEFEAMDHEWLYYFVTGNGGTIADYEVVSVEKADDTHAVATIKVRQKWEDGSFDETSDIEEHKLYMEKVDGQWLMSDFDGHKQDCIHHIAINRREQALRNAISDYLAKEIGSQYSKGDLCVPVLMMVAEEDSETATSSVWGDFWIFNYRIAGDTLKTVSGGNHSGRMTIRKMEGTPYVADGGRGRQRGQRQTHLRPALRCLPKYARQRECPRSRPKRATEGVYPLARSQRPLLSGLWLGGREVVIHKTTLSPLLHFFNADWEFIILHSK